MPDNFLRTLKRRLAIRTRLKRLCGRVELAAFARGFAFNENNRQLSTLRNRLSGRRVFLLGNGPSLRISDLDKLQNEVCFAANKIYLSFGETRWRPSFYFVEDNLVLQQNWEQIAALDCCPKFLPKRSLEWAPRIPGAAYYDFHWEDPTDASFPTFGRCPLRGFYWGSTVMYSMLQFAAFMNAESVYLLGVDFNFALPKAAPAGIELASEGEVNHFSKAYRAPGEKWNIPNLDIQTKGFTRARRQAEADGWRIFNATRGGKLEVFPRVDFDAIV